MSCEGCSSYSAGEDGKPAGCQSNGGCSTGGCNKFNVYNWLSDYPLSDFGTIYDVVEVSFQKGNRKEFYRNTDGLSLFKGDWITVESGNGLDVGQVSVTGELVKLQMKKYGVQDNDQINKILRKSTEEELDQYHHAKSREKDTLLTARVIASTLNLEMKITEVEFQADEKKVTVFYTAHERVDFRELIKLYASEFRTKIEMRQIGARQESAKIGGIGSCGRELCCSTWLVDFKSVNTTAARYQNLSINQTKLSGQCGRLKCCLNYELDTYMDALKGFPKHADVIYLKKGKAFLQKKDIFRNLMWYGFEGTSKHYPLTIERVQEIILLNEKKIFPDELEHVEVAAVRQDATKLVDVGFVNDVGQLSLQSLGRSRKNRNNRPKPKAKRTQVNTSANKQVATSKTSSSLNEEGVKSTHNQRRERSQVGPKRKSIKQRAHSTTQPPVQERRKPEERPSAERPKRRAQPNRNRSQRPHQNRSASPTSNDKKE